MIISWEAIAGIAIAVSMFAAAVYYRATTREEDTVEPLTGRRAPAKSSVHQ